MRAAVESTRTPLVLGSLGGFAGLVSAAKFVDPVLAAGTDTVGSKALLQRQTGRLRDLGVDLVAMSVNDVVTCGAEPVLFLDCISIGRLDPERVAQLVEGVADGCRQAGCALLGGETAEMPDLYGPTTSTSPGSRSGSPSAGVSSAVPASRPAMPSSGSRPPGCTRTASRSSAACSSARASIRPTRRAGLLAPTAIYAQCVRELMRLVDVRAMAHVTGGGIPGNLPRVLPAGLGARLELAAWPRPDVFGWLAGLGVEEDEMRKVFNIGLGYLVVVPAAEANEAVRVADAAGQTAYRVGEIVRGDGVELV